MPSFEERQHRQRGVQWLARVREQRRRGLDSEAGVGGAVVGSGVYCRPPRDSRSVADGKVGEWAEGGREVGGGWAGGRGGRARTQQTSARVPEEPALRLSAMICAAKAGSLRECE